MLLAAMRVYGFPPADPLAGKVFGNMRGMGWTAGVQGRSGFHTLESTLVLYTSANQHARRLRCVRRLQGFFDRISSLEILGHCVLCEATRPLS